MREKTVMDEQPQVFRFAFHFDLDEARLREFYPSETSTGYKKAWSDVRSFMEARDFVHTQYSGYESTVKMYYADAYVILNSLRRNFPWFSQCAKAATLTEIGERYNVLEHLRAQASEVEYLVNPVERRVGAEQAKVAQVMKAITPGAGQAQPGLATAPTRPQTSPQPQSGLGR